MGCIVGASVPHTLLLTPALAVTPFVSGALRGPKGVAECLAVQLGAVSITAAQMGWHPMRARAAPCSPGSCRVWVRPVGRFVRAVQDGVEDPPDALP